MRRILLTLLIALGVAFPVAMAAPDASVGAINAVPICESTAADTEVCSEVKDGKSSEDPIIGVIRVAITILSYIIGIAAIIVIVVSGMRLITSQGDAQGVATARSALIYAAIALAVAALARVIVGFILNAI